MMKDGANGYQVSAEPALMEKLVGQECVFRLLASLTQAGVPSLMESPMAL